MKRDGQKGTGRKRERLNGEPFRVPPGDVQRAQGCQAAVAEAAAPADGREGAEIGEDLGWIV